MRSKRYSVMLLLAAGAVLFALAAPALAQEAVAEAGVQRTTLMQLIRQGGLFMVPLGALSVAMLGLGVYGFMTVTDEKMMRVSILPRIKEHLDRLELQETADLCEQHPSFLTNALAAGLSRLSHGVFNPQSMEQAMEEATVEENAVAIKPISYLSIIASVSPMIGLLGTVAGMIGAFQKIGMGGMGDPEILASDIGMAMVTTATGLIIGIPSMFLYFLLKSRFIAKVSRIGRVLGNILHDLQMTVDRGGGPAATARSE